MPSNWIEADVLRLRTALGPWNTGSSTRRVGHGRILRAAGQPSDASNSYWDVVLLLGGEQEIDFVESGALTNALPVRPFVTNVSAPVSSTYATGDLVSVSLETIVRRTYYNIQTGLSAAEDYVEVFPGNHWIISGSGSGSCRTAYNEWGILFG